MQEINFIYPIKMGVKFSKQQINALRTVAQLFTDLDDNPDLWELISTVIGEIDIPAANDIDLLYSANLCDRLADLGDNYYNT